MAAFDIRIAQLTSLFLLGCGADSALSPLNAIRFATKNCGIGDAFTNTCKMSPSEQREQLFHRDPFRTHPAAPSASKRPARQKGETGRPGANLAYAARQPAQGAITDIFRRVCAEEQLGADCWVWLTALCRHESGGCRQDAYNPELEKGDGFASYGPFQIRVFLHRRHSPAPLSEISLGCAYDFACAARWTARELKYYGYPRDTVGAICHHNGARGAACQRYYALVAKTIQ